jgi:hypothetical protein
MNKFIKITIGSTILGLMAATLFFWYSQIVSHLQPADLRPIWQSTMPPPLSISPVFLLLVGFFLLAILRLRRKKP